MPNFGAGEWMIILLVVLLLFGSAKLPQLARSLGKSARILKAETKGLHEDEAEQPAADAQAATPAQPDARERAAQLREEAARLEREAAAKDAPQRQQNALPAGEPIQGVPVSDYGQRKSS